LDQLRGAKDTEEVKRQLTDVGRKATLLKVNERILTDRYQVRRDKLLDVVSIEGSLREMGMTRLLIVPLVPSQRLLLSSPAIYCAYSLVLSSAR
jgi:hypothetical protein